MYIESTMSESLDKVYDEFVNRFGFGPCGAFAALKREQGWGDVAVCIAIAPNGAEFTHYVIWDNGIIDLANPFGESLTYTEIEILDADEMPELNEDGEMIAWLRDRGV